MLKRSLYKVYLAGIGAATLVPSAAHAAEGGSESGGSWLTLGFFALNFAAFLFVAIYFALPLARSFFTSRADSIRASLDSARNALDEAQTLARDAEARTAALDAELARIKAEFETETNYQIARIREIAQATAARLKRDAQMSAGAMTETAQRRVRERLAAAAAALARDLIARNFSGDDQGRLLDGFMEKLGQDARR